MAEYVLMTRGEHEGVSQSGRTIVSDANPLPLNAVAGSGVANDASAASANPTLVGFYASATAPTDVSGDTDAVRAWALRSGAQVVQTSFAGTLAVGGSGVVGAGVQRVVLATDVGLPAGESHLGQIGTGGNVVQVTPTLDTSAYTANDVLFDATEVAGAVRVSGGRAVLESVVVLDEDDQAAAAMTLFFLRSNVSLGTANAAPSISDANARELLGSVAVASGDFVDVGGSKVATVKNVGLVVEPTTGTSVWVAGTTAGTPTQTASGIKVSLGFRYL